MNIRVNLVNVILVFLILFFSAILFIAIRDHRSDDKGVKVSTYMKEYKFDGGIRCFTTHEKAISCIQIKE